MTGRHPATWSLAQRVVHGSIAPLVLLLALLGLSMVGVTLRQMLLKFALYQLHKTLGITVFLLAATLLALHWRRGRPAAEPGLPLWQKRAASLVHAALFGLLFATPLAGYLAAATAPAGIPTLFLGFVSVPHIVNTDPAWFAVLRQVHLAFALLLLALASGHAAMALRHHRQGRRTLARMWRG